MEKLKNLVNPGSKKDDEVMYGSGLSDDPVHTGLPSTGGTNNASGSHFGSSSTAGHDPLSSSNALGTNQYDTASAGGASHGLSEPYASRMPGGFDDDDAATTASVSSGVPGQSQSRSATTGANDLYFTEKPLPPEPASDTGIGHGQSSLTGNSYPDRSVENRARHEDQSGSSHLGRDAAFGAGAAGTSALRHEDPQQENYAPETGRSFPLGGSSPSDVYGSTNAGHSSNLASEADPRVDSDGSRNTGYGSASGAYLSSTGAAPTPGSQGSLGRDTLGAGAGAGSEEPERTLNTGYGPESWQHEHHHHGHEYEGDPCETGGVESQRGPHFVSGPHLTDTANRLDPRVGSGPGIAGTTGDSSGHHHDHSHNVQRGEEAALAGGAGPAGLGALEADNHEKGTTGNATSSALDPSSTDRRGVTSTGGDAYDSNRSSTAGVSSTGKTAGPHKSDMLNKLDPRVNSDVSKLEASHRNDQHDERDVALTGTGVAGLYESEKHHRGNEPNQAKSNTTSDVGGQDPYNSGFDPRVDTTRSGMARDESAVSLAGSGQPATAPDHHFNRDAGIVGTGGIGAYEAEKHLGSSDHAGLSPTPQDRLAGSGHQPAIASNSSPYPSSSYSKGTQPQTGSHNGRDPLATGVIGAGAFGEGDRAEKTRDYGRTDPAKQVREHQYTGASTAAYPSPGYGGDSEKARHTSQHPEGDAALVGGAGAGALASHEYSHRDAAGYGKEPYQDISRGPSTGRDAAIIGGAGTGAIPSGETGQAHHVGRDTAAVGGAGSGTGAMTGYANSQRDVAGHDAEPYQDSSREHHTGRDAAIVGGAAGAGGLAEREHSKKDAAKLLKEHGKEEKALEKEHSKEVKHHQKELVKEEKAHQKAIEKSEKKHEKAMEKDETKQEHGGKKHGGLLGFLHRDKPDKEVKGEEAHRQTATHPGHGEEEMAAGPGATGLESRSGYDPLQGEHGSQSGVHDTPIGIGSGITTHSAYGAHDSGHNKLHKDPPPKVVESRGYELQ